MKKRIALGLLVVGVISTLAVGCSNTNVDNETSKHIVAPKVKESLTEYKDVITEVDAILNYVYKGESKPSGSYMEHIDNLVSERENQKIYLDDFLYEIEKLREELEGHIEQDGNNVVIDENSVVEEDDYVMEVEVLPDSAFIKTDETGRDYIDINDLEFFTDNLLFRYNNIEYMLDMKDYKPTMKTIRISKHNYRYSYGSEIEPGRIVMVYIDTKTGIGKTITVTHTNGKINLVDFEL